jgi:hypothetical protein
MKAEHEIKITTNFYFRSCAYHNRWDEISAVHLAEARVPSDKTHLCRVSIMLAFLGRSPTRARNRLTTIQFGAYGAKRPLAEC